MSQTEYPREITLKDLRKFADLDRKLNSDLFNIWNMFLSSVVGITHADVIDEEPHLAPHPELKEAFIRCQTLEDIEALGQKVGIDYDTLATSSDAASDLLARYKMSGYGETSSRIQ